jgi:uncharacterized protein (DUF2164 family)
MAINLSEEIRQKLQESIKQFFDEHLDESIGDLKASLVLDYCLKEIGPSVYNQAIRDAQAYMQEKTSDMDSVCYEPELGYWQEKR